MSTIFQVKKKKTLKESTLITKVGKHKMKQSVLKLRNKSNTYLQTWRKSWNS